MITRGSVFLLTALIPCLGFNLDSENPTIFQMDRDGFGQSVVQFDGSRLVVGAPLEKGSSNQTGQLYECEFGTGTKECKQLPLQIPSDAVNMSLGMTLAAGTTPSQLLACGPTVHQACGENLHLNGFCFLLGSNLQLTRRIPPALQDCPKQESDIVFLIDGSGSINERDFDQMKQFVRAVMRQFQGTNTLFSLMQFSDSFQTHFTFKVFKRNPNPEVLLIPISQLTGLTYTATGIKKVVEELFQQSQGARKDATKILIVITDGQKYEDPLEYSDAIPLAEAAGIIRYAIGVGAAFEKYEARKELDSIASDPPRDHVFQVNNFGALDNIQNQLQEKIFAIEGTQTGSSSSFQHEMSQEGFSALLTPDGPVLGAVGSFDWSGGVSLYPPKEGSTFINVSQQSGDMHDAYLGYSTDVAIQKRIWSLVLGAPRYQHTGKVVMFRKTTGIWYQWAEVTGAQIGSYFGATVCAVDVDRDGNTDLILIGTPHHYAQKAGGLVSVCPMPLRRVDWRCESVLRGQPGQPLARFGAALAVLGDTNGDGLADVAVGAPGEEENRGAVYLFHGAAPAQINPTYSQRIGASQLSPGLRYFGQALSGGQDLTQDGLVDVAVGARGQALLLRSRPVLRVDVSLRFKPPELARAVFDCGEQTVLRREAGEARVCLTVRKTSRDRLGPGDIQSSVTYDLALDPGRLNPRAVFDQTNTRTLRSVRSIGLEEKCETVKLLLPTCVEDSVTPIILRLNFSLLGQPIPSSGQLRPMLAAGSQDQFTTASLPFEKNCGADSICQDDLSVTFSFSSQKTLVVGTSPDLNVTVTVRNEGEDSYGTLVTFSYPPGLSLRRASVLQNPRQPRVPRLICESAQLRSSSCSISHPIFREGAEATFLVTFDVPPTADFGSSLLLSANATSDNNIPRTNKTFFQQQLPVKYGVNVVINSGEQSTSYLNFSASEEKSGRVLQHQYHVNNLGLRSLDVNVTFWIPLELDGLPVWTTPEVIPPQDFQGQCVNNRENPRDHDFRSLLQRSPDLNCSVAVCQRIHCSITSFQVRDELTFTLKGNLSFGWVGQTKQKRLSVLSSATLMFDTGRYAQFPGQEGFLTAQAKTVVERYEVYNPLPLIVGSSVGGLVLLALLTAGLYKLGFFKRQYKDMMTEGAPAAGETPDVPPPE
ncbi:integrin alpha-M isoform X2 [Ornithorhynchus anatinus]|uniref:VWFA domain-containing protein n=1 Tax=Ornithorhynchus anatinus TaxID=9258 RepID=A0A6I8N3N3_ORNAN|nr:integrin alpha-M isoform X2 [Ornithorhynchus anatinus]